MQTIPLQPVPAQICKVVLGGQNCQLNLYQKNQGLFFDLQADNVEIVSGVVCRDIDALIARLYTGFVGNLFFIDTRGNDDPDYTGLNGRFSLVYLTAAEYELFLQ